MASSKKRVVMAVAGVAIVGGAIGLIAWALMKKKPVTPPSPANTPHVYTFHPAQDWTLTDAATELVEDFVSIEAAKAKCDANPRFVAFVIFKGKTSYREKLATTPKDWATEGLTFNPEVEGTYVRV